MLLSLILSHIVPRFFQEIIGKLESRIFGFTIKPIKHDTAKGLHRIYYKRQEVSKDATSLLLGLIIHRNRLVSSFSSTQFRLYLSRKQSELSVSIKCYRLHHRC